MRTSSASRLRAVLAGIVLALAGGCVQQVNYVERFQDKEPERFYVVVLEGPKKPVVRHSPGQFEVRFGRHTLLFENDRLLYDQTEVMKIDPDVKAIDIRITRERIKVMAGKEVLYRLI